MPFDPQQGARPPEVAIEPEADSPLAAVMPGLQCRGPLDEQFDRSVRVQVRQDGVVGGLVRDDAGTVVRSSEDSGLPPPPPSDISAPFKPNIFAKMPIPYNVRVAQAFFLHGRPKFLN